MNPITRMLLGIRKAVSNLVANVRKETNWEPELPISNSPNDDYNEDEVISAVDNFMGEHFVWKQDEAYGLFDNVQTIKHMNLQLQTKNVINGDCDDAATYTAYLLLKTCKYVSTYRVNMLDRRHVVCVACFDTNIEKVKHCYVFSNGKCYYETKSYTPAEALRKYRDDKVAISEGNIRIGIETVSLSSKADHIIAYPKSDWA